MESYLCDICSGLNIDKKAEFTAYRRFQLVPTLIYLCSGCVYECLTDLVCVEGIPDQEEGDKNRLPIREPDLCVSCRCEGKSSQATVIARFTHNRSLFVYPLCDECLKNLSTEYTPIGFSSIPSSSHQDEKGGS